MRTSIPKSHYVYEFAYPQNMPLPWSGETFYVGKGTRLTRMDDHFKEAVNGCSCLKCQAIRLVWKAGLAVSRRIVFESTNELEVFQKEKQTIIKRKSPFLTNIIHNTHNNAPKYDTKCYVGNGEIWLCRLWAASYCGLYSGKIRVYDIPECLEEFAITIGECKQYSETFYPLGIVEKFIQQARNNPHLPYTAVKGPEQNSKKGIYCYLKTGNAHPPEYNTIISQMLDGRITTEQARAAICQAYDVALEKAPE